MRNKKAFTLIELLVVIAIIAILAALLFPVFAKAKEAAKKISNLNNFKQMAIASHIYTTDYDDRMMRSYTIRPDESVRWNVIHPVPEDWHPLASVWMQDGSEQENSGYWANAMFDYVKNDGIYGDSSFTYRIGSFDATNYTDRQKDPRKMHVSYNGLLHTMATTQIEHVATVPVFWSGSGGTAGYEGRAISNPQNFCVGTFNNAAACKFQTYDGPSWGWFWLNWPEGSAWTYSGGQNMARADSSARFYKLSDVPNPVSGWVEDYSNNPFAGFYNDKGVPEYAWGCTTFGGLSGNTSYSCFFRPDRPITYF